MKTLVTYFIILISYFSLAQNTVSYSPASTTVNATSGVEIIVPITVSCSGPQENMLVNITPSNTCATTDGWRGYDYTNGVTAIKPAQTTTLKIKFKKTVSTDTTLEYLFTNNSCFSPQISITVNYKAPVVPTCTLPAPAGFVVSNVQSNAATFSWNAVAGASQYILSVGGSSESTSGTSLYVNNANLLAGKSYTAYLQAICANGITSNVSSSISFTTLCPTYAAPTNVTATPNGNMYVINFTSIPNYFGYYVLDYVNLTNNSSGSQTLSNGDFFYYVSAPNSFKFKIRPVGCPAPASDWVTVIPNACPSGNYPSNLMYFPICGSTPGRCCGYGNFKWNAVSGANKYKVEYVGVNLTNPNVSSITGSFETASSNTTQSTLYACSSSQAGTWIIKFRVQSRCSNGTWSDYSPWSTNYAW